MHTCIYMGAFKKYTCLGATPKVLIWFVSSGTCGFPQSSLRLKVTVSCQRARNPPSLPSQDLSPSLKKSGPSLQYFRKLSKLRDWLEAKTTVRVTLRLSDFQTHCWESFKEQNEQSVRQEDTSFFFFFPLNLFFSEVTKKSFVSRHESKIHIHFGL